MNTSLLFISLSIVIVCVLLYLGAGKADLLGLDVEFSVVDTDKDITKNPESVCRVTKTLETTQAKGLTICSLLYVRNQSIKPRENQFS